MGQRLVVFVGEGSKAETAKAAIYFHWSGYERYAVPLTAKIAYALSEVDDLDDFSAVVERLLRWVTDNGGGVRGYQHDVAAIQKIVPSYDPNKDFGDRDHGILTITPDGINSFWSWSEYSMYIDLKSRTVKLFGVKEYWPAEEFDATNEWDYYKDPAGIELFVWKNPPYDPRACPLEHALELLEYIEKSSAKFYGEEYTPVSSPTPWSISPEKFVSDHLETILGLDSK
jgi:hypothetical protein